MASSSPPLHSPIINGTDAVHFDEIDIGMPPPPIPRRNAQSISNRPAFYSITHGFSVDEDGDEEMVEEKPKMPSMELPASVGAVDANETNGKTPNEGIVPNNQNSPPPSPYPLSAVNLLPTDISEEKDGIDGKPPPIELASDHPQPPSPPHNHQSPPPIYSTVYPPGIYPAPCYAAPQNAAQSQHQQPQGQHHVPAAYIIDASVLNGMPAVLIRQGPNGQCAGQFPINLVMVHPGMEDGL